MLSRTALSTSLEQVGRRCQVSFWRPAKACPQGGQPVIVNVSVFPEFSLPTTRAVIPIEIVPLNWLQLASSPTYCAKTKLGIAAIFVGTPKLRYRETSFHATFPYRS